MRRHPFFRRTLVLVAAAVWLLGGLVKPCPAQEPRGIVFEDRAKRISFRPPKKWVYDPASDREALMFTGPKASGITSRLTIRTLLDGRPFDAAVERFLSEHVGIPADEKPEMESLEGLQSRFLEQAVTWVRKVKAREVRMIVAMARNGPYLVSLVFEVPSITFERIAPDILACMSSVEPTILTPVYSDAKMGIAFYYLPRGFEVDGSATQKGTVIAWELKRDGSHLGSLSAGVMGPAAIGGHDMFLKRVEKERKKLESAPDTRKLSEAEFCLSGRRGVIHEYVKEYDEGRLLNTRWNIYIQNARHLIIFYCGAESGNFENRMRAIYDQFIRSIDIELAFEEEE